MLQLLDESLPNIEGGSNFILTSYLDPYKNYLCPTNYGLSSVQSTLNYLTTYSLT